MKFATAVVALAATAIAAPTNGGDHGGNNPGQCNNNGNYVCCNGLLGLLCVIDVLGNTCSGGSYCCKAAPQNGLINIGLDCLKIL